MTVRMKIIIGFALVAFAAIAVGMFALQRMGAVQDEFDRVRLHWLPNILTNAEGTDLVTGYRVEVVRYVAERDAAQRAEIGRALTAQRTRIDDWFAGLAGRQTEAEGRLHADTAKAAWDRYRAVSLTLLAAAERGAQAEAQALYNGDARTAFGAAHAALVRLRAFSERGAVQEAENAEQAHRSAVWMILGAIALAALLAAASTFQIDREVTRRVLRLTGAMRQLAARDYSFDLPDAARSDEIGILARAVEECRTGLREADALAEARAKEEQARLARIERVETLVRGFEADAAAALGQVAAAATELDATAGEMGGAAAEGARMADALATASQGSTSNTQAAAAAAEELTSSIGEIARQVSRAAEVARRAVAEAERTDGTVHSLSEGAARIGDVVRLISDIAGQTNLLALNATIEAARAGEAGKGFAVVASEVKTLAAQTAKATEEIGQQIAAIQGATAQAVEAIRGIGAVVGEIDQTAAAIAAAVEEQGAATQEIARSIAGAADAAGAVTRETEGARAATARTGAAAEQVRGASAELARQAETIRARVDGFLAGMRAA